MPRRAKIPANPKASPARLTDQQVDGLLAAVPTQLSQVKREELRIKVAQAIADARRCQRDFDTRMTSKQIEAKLKPLRTHLQSIHFLLRDNPYIVLRLNWYADTLAAAPGRGCELIFDPDPAKGLFVRGRKLVALSVENILFLEALTTELQSQMSGPDRNVGRRANNYDPHLNFLCSTLMLIFRDIFGNSPKLNAASYNETKGKGSPLVEFIRAAFLLFGTSDGGDRVKQRIIKLRAKTKIMDPSIRSTFPIHM